jgi:hypothetical protein
MTTHPTDRFINTENVNGGTFYWKVSNESQTKPKDLCIEEALINGHELVVEKQSRSPYNQQTVWRRFGHFKDVDSYLKGFKYQNHHVFEVIKGECKLYLDLEWAHDANNPETDVDMKEYIANTLIPHYRAVYPEIPISEADVYVCTASQSSDFVTQR